jgi:hypothetical protein
MSRCLVPLVLLGACAHPVPSTVFLDNSPNHVYRGDDGALYVWKSAPVDLPDSRDGVDEGALGAAPLDLDSLKEGVSGACEVWHGRLYVFLRRAPEATFPTTWACAVPGHSGGLVVEVPRDVP